MIVKSGSPVSCGVPELSRLAWVICVLGLARVSVADEVRGELAVLNQQMLRGELKHHKMQQLGGVELVAGVTRAQQIGDSDI